MINRKHLQSNCIIAGAHYPLPINGLLIIVNGGEWYMKPEKVLSCMFLFAFLALNVHKTQ